MYQWIASVMLASGIIGGLVNRYLLDKTEDDSMPWWQCVIVGIAAAFIVPLFLNMISSGLIRDILGSLDQPGDSSKLFVLGGFCLAAAISSRAFINTVSQRVLQEAREAKEDAAKAQQDAAEAKASLATVIEPDDAAEEATGREREISFQAAEEVALSDDEKEVMSVMVNSSFAMRSLSGLSKQAGLDAGRVNIALTSLIEKGLAAQGTSLKGYPRWYLTTDGRVALAQI